jgi:hypothetical protein
MPFADDKARRRFEDGLRQAGIPDSAPPAAAERPAAALA